MAFPRAKIQRFNDVKDYTPSPADYNVALKSHVAGATIPKSGRFQDLTSPSHSDSGSVSSHASAAHTFRTPNPPRRLKHQSRTTSIDRQAKPVDLFQSADNIEALKEKIVECNNKDLYIQEITEQLEEMKQQLNDMETQVTSLQIDKADLQEQNIHYGEAVKSLKVVNQVAFQKLVKEITELKRKNGIMKNEYTVLKKENEKDLASILENISKLNNLHDILIQNYETLLNEKTNELENKNKELKDFINLERNREQVLVGIKKEHNKKLEELQFEMLKVVSEMQKQLEKEKENHYMCIKELKIIKEKELENVCLKFEKEKSYIQEDALAKIKQLQENHNEIGVLAEIQMKEKISDIELSCNIKLEAAKSESEAILKECQSIAEYNIIQTEVEKNKALYELEEKTKALQLVTNEHNNLKTDINSLNKKCEHLESKLKIAQNELSLVKEESAKIINQMIKEKKTYEITINKTHKTVEALKHRLLRSDQDVEQLKAELEITEESKIEFETKCTKLMEELQIICGLCEVMEDQNQLALKVAEEKIVNLEKHLLEKVDYFKEKAEDRINVLEDELKKTKCTLETSREQLHEQQKLNTEACILIDKSKSEIEHLEHVRAENNTKIDHLEAAFCNLQLEFSKEQSKEIALNKINEYLKEENTKLIDTVDVIQKREHEMLKQLEDFETELTNHKNCQTILQQQKQLHKESEEYKQKFCLLLEDFNNVSQKFIETKEENCQLCAKVAAQESLIGPFRDHLKAYEMEYKALMNEKADAEKEAKEMGLKYAEILGHQNQKQKIKHLVDLKQKYYELSESKKELESKVRIQKKTIEKLKKDLQGTTKSPSKIRPKKEDKENIESPNKTNSNRIDSPGGPLKNRN